ncbi:MAG: hypothetical protein IPP63_11260 [Chloracidobacterium sp.]|nr:hypothetical protein [Chloracidobacterium sp.]
MASLLDIGNGPFLAVKIAMGTIAAFVLVRWGGRPLARYGMAIALAIYIGLMGVHLFTGLAAFGYVSADQIKNFTDIPGQLFAFFV